MLGVGDVLQGLALPAGLLVGGGAVSAAIVTTTQLLIFTTVVVNWPLLVGGLIAGAALSGFGVFSLSGLRSRLQQRFEDTLLPTVQAALVGDGACHEGHHVPSLRSQFVQRVRDTAEAACHALEAHS
jgi:hypothetical protein